METAPNAESREIPRLPAPVRLLGVGIVILWVLSANWVFLLARSGVVTIPPQVWLYARLARNLGSGWIDTLVSLGVILPMVNSFALAAAGWGLLRRRAWGWKVAMAASLLQAGNVFAKVVANVFAAWFLPGFGVRLPRWLDGQDLALFVVALCLAAGLSSAIVRQGMNPPAAWSRKVKAWLLVLFLLPSLVPLVALELPLALRGQPRRPSPAGTPATGTVDPQSAGR